MTTFIKTSFFRNAIITMEFKGFILDTFQERAIQAINRNNSCVVSASTGTGKTLIADYIIHKHLPEGKTIIYTAPIKALSNQKFKDFKEEYGEDNVGLMTGDRVINSTAPLIVMTTEIFRNMLVTGDDMVDSISYVVFDEIHYINDRQRGTVWEESIIFSPEHVRFLCLSATIPNYDEFANWIETIKGHKVETVHYAHRPVPLEHLVFDKKLGMTTIEKVQQDKLKDEMYAEQMYVGQKKNRGPKKSKRSFLKKVHSLKPPYHLEVIPEIENSIPALYFCFSRKKCEDFAGELASKKNFLPDSKHAEVSSFIRQNLNAEIAKMDTTKKLRRALLRGIGFHHSGVLPQLKQIVEQLFAKGLISVLYTTETFSVGINMPAKTVVFDSLEKYDGVSMRMLNSKEYFQIAGRAGRRGIDTKGTVVALVNRKFTDLDKFYSICQKDVVPIISQFKLSVNTVLNLLSQYDEKTQGQVLKSSFDYYVRTKNNKKAVHVLASFNNKIKNLLKLGFIKKSSDFKKEMSSAYIDFDKKYLLTEKGEFARHIYFNEVALTELFFRKDLSSISDLDLLIILATITYEPKRMDYFMIKGSEKTYHRILKRFDNTPVFQDVNKISLKRMINFVSAWATGATFIELMKYTNMQEGDVIRFFRRLIDVLTQLKRATDNQRIQGRIETLIEKIDRGLVSSDI
ncbi:MAG: DEAD/DEAH box helicase [Nanobdellota archaeon]